MVRKMSGFSRKRVPMNSKKYMAARSKIRGAFRSHLNRKWRDNRKRTPFALTGWSAKTAKYGTNARGAQNKWRANYLKKHGRAAYKPRWGPNYVW